MVCSVSKLVTVNCSLTKCRSCLQHMLLAVKTIHEDRIVHADLKPANFLLVKGELKLIDFGIAKAIQNDTTHIVRDSGVSSETPNIRFPFLLSLSMVLLNSLENVLLTPVT